MEKSKEKKEGISKKKVTKKVKTIKNNSAFKRAMVQIDIKSGDKVLVTFNDGSRYEVERK